MSNEVAAVGFVGANATVPVVDTATVFALRGLKSTASRKSYDLPVVGETNFGISWVVIADVFAVLLSSTGYESTDKKPMPCERSLP